MMSRNNHDSMYQSGNKSKLSSANSTSAQKSQNTVDKSSLSKSSTKFKSPNIIQHAESLIITGGRKTISAQYNPNGADIRGSIQVSGGCCDLCRNQNGDKCWRQCLIEYLESRKEYVLCMEETKNLSVISEEQTGASHDSSKPKFTSVKQVFITGENTKSKSWRQQLIDYIKEKGGSYQDKKWQLQYFEEY